MLANHKIGFLIFSANRFGLLLQLAWRLRAVNIYRAFTHRFKVRRGFYKTQLPEHAGAVISGFWHGLVWQPRVTANHESTEAICKRADEIVSGVFRRFEDELISEGTYPEWHKQSYVDQRSLHFSDVRINAIAGEDVKLCWDLSRFKWLTHLVIGAVHAKSQDDAYVYLKRAESLLRDWVKENGFFMGVNWACGQEVSIRAIHLMNSLLLLKKHFGAHPSDDALEFLKCSYQRVDATIGYSQAQENNHSLTECLFLFYAPVFLKNFGVNVGSLDNHKKRKARARSTILRLVQADGSFRMYSINYNRAICDIIALFKVIDDALEVGFWEGDLLTRVANLQKFMQSVVLESGGAPNIGHNDGSLHALQYDSYDNYAPSIIFLSSVFSFSVSRIYSWAETKLFCFGYSVLYTDHVLYPCKWFDDFGLGVIKSSRYVLFIKYARNSGRPSQEDFLHLDLWVRGENVLHDSGSFSYNPADPSLVEYFDSAEAHNGPFAKDRSLVARVGRFLYLEWPYVQLDCYHGRSGLEVEMSLETINGVRFKRSLILKDRSIHIVDKGPADIPWGISFNIPRVLSPDTRSYDFEIAEGVILTSSEEMIIESAVYSKKYLDMQNGTRIKVDGDSAHRSSVIEIRDR